MPAEDEPWRTPTTFETALVAMFLEEAFPGSSELLEQWRSATVRTIDEHGFLDIRPATTAPAPAAYLGGPVFGSWKDEGISTEVLLHLDRDGRMRELEFVIHPGGTPAHELDPNTMWVLAPPWRPS